jgi:phosphoglycerate kinase
VRRTLRQLTGAELAGRRALVRVDYNVPLAEGGVRDLTRIQASLPTLEYLIERDARPVLLSHLGRPGGSPDPSCSLEPVAEALAAASGREVRFIRGPADSAAALEASHELRPGEILLLENTRFLRGETSNDKDLSRRLARLGELFVNDAFGTAHRAHASTVGVPTRLKPAVAGLLIELELAALDRLRGEIERPFVVALGGAKIGDKIQLLEEFLGRADRILVGGAMANTFLRARGEAMGASLVEDGALATARAILDRAGPRIELPVDLVVSADREAGEDAHVVASSEVPPGTAALDIGPETRERFRRAVLQARTFFWNGPMGLFEIEPFAAGTKALARAAAEATAGGAFTVVGGGDSASAIREAGLADAVSHVSTGGGAALEYLAHGSLPGIEALDKA